MFLYKISGQEIHFSCPFPGLEAIHPSGTPEMAVPEVLSGSQQHVARATGWVAGAERLVEVWAAGDGLRVRVGACRDLLIAPGGKAIIPGEGEPELTQIECEVVLGPALVLALALGDKWSLHASAAESNGTAIAFLGESGEGKSTLAQYLSESGRLAWRRITDDILPVSLGPAGLTGWPRFPQLKLPAPEQMGRGLPEQVPVSRVYLLAPAEAGIAPAAERLTATEAVQALIGHTAGSRLFFPNLLARHLAFCARAAARIPVYRLAYPHTRAALPEVRKILEA